MAEKPEPPPPPGNNTDSRTWRPKRDSREDVIAAVRELMGLGPNDPTPQPPPAPPSDDKKDEKKTEDDAAASVAQAGQAAARNGPMILSLGRGSESFDERSPCLGWRSRIVGAGGTTPRARNPRPRPRNSPAPAQPEPPRLPGRDRQPRLGRRRQRPQTAKHQAWIKQVPHLVHNSRTASPANEPVNLETASLTNLLPQAATWERVLRKLSVRAMPPQGMPHPTEADYVGFTTWLPAHSIARGKARAHRDGTSFIV